MGKSLIAWILACAAALSFAALPTPARERSDPRPIARSAPTRLMPRLPRAVDVNPDPRVYETTLVAMEAQVDLDGDGRPEDVYTYNGIVPSPEIRVRVGDTVIVHFENRLPKPSSIHWHGVELNNASDGTPVTQNAVLTGGTYTYEFVVPRPGVFWYHPHFRPTNDEFKGQYGSFIVEDPREVKLQRLGLLPKPRNTMTLMLADTTICKAQGDNDDATFPADPTLPWAGEGPFPGNDAQPTPATLCEMPLDDHGYPAGSGALAAGAIPNVQPSPACAQSAAVSLTGIDFVPGTPALLYGVDGGGTLYEVVPMTAEVVPVGPTGFVGLQGLAFDPLTARLWSRSSSAQTLVSIDPATATARMEVAPGGLFDLNVRDLAFLADGSLYAVGHTPGTVSGARLYSIDRASGVAIRLSGGGQGIAPHSAGALLQNVSKPFPAGDQFAIVDVTTVPPSSSPIAGWPGVAVATQLARMPGGDIAYGINGCSAFCTGQLYRYDLAAMTAELVGSPSPSGCSTQDGQLVLTNGAVAAPRAGSPEAPGDLAKGPSIVDVLPGEGRRFRVINAAVSRYFRLRLTGPGGELVPLHRVGGEGGLLDRVRLEGGVEGEFETKYRRGEIVLGPSERADVVAVLPPAIRGDVFTLWTLDYSHTRSGFARVPTVPLLHLRAVASGPRGDRFAIDEGDPLRVHEAINDPIEELEGLPVVDHLLDPTVLPTPLPGSSNETIRLDITDKRPSIDGYHGAFPGSAVDFTLVPHLPTSRYARVGDLLELTVANETAMHHPFHLHGFSFQPVRLEDSGGQVMRAFDYNEFMDTFDIPPRRRLVFRVRLDDRLRNDGATPGGALGRWLFHCHISTHAGLGMISELVVLP